VKRVRPDRIILALAGLFVLFLALCPPLDYSGRWVHLWPGEALRLAADRKVELCARLLLIELAILEVVVGVTLFASRALRNRSGGARLTRRHRIVLLAGVILLALLLFPPFRVSRTCTPFRTHVAHAFVTTPREIRDRCRRYEVHVRLLAAEVGVVVVAAATLAVVLGRKRAGNRQQ
jgi:hypothetical protein